MKKDEAISFKSKVDNMIPSNAETTDEETEKTTSFYTSYRTQRQSNTSVNKPAFKVSAFVSSLNNTANNLSVNSSFNASSLDVSMKRSPFYRGGTTFGGASSYRESSTGKRVKLSPVSNRVRTTRTLMKAKPLPNMKRNVVTSQTAKRILSTLGKMSSPVKDSKKIPSSVFSKPALSELVKNQAKLITKTKESTAPPVNAMHQTSKAAKIIQAVKNNPLQNKTDIMKRFEKISTSQASNPFSFSTLPKKQSEVQPLSKKAVQPIPAIPSTTVQQPTTEVSKANFKMKREKTSVSHFSINKEPEIVNTMPEITAATASLPITALPKFDFANKIMNQPKASNIFSPSLNVTPIAKPQEKKIVNNAPPISFGTPEILRPAFAPKLQQQSFDFTSPNVINNKRDIDTITSKDFAFSTPVNCAKDNKLDSFPAKVMKKQEMTAEIPPVKLEFKSNEGVTKKPDVISTQQPIKSFEVKKFSTFKKQDTNLWNCPTCLISNNDSVSKCIACGDSKPGKSLSTMAEIKPLNTSKLPTKTLKMNFGKPSDQWECSTCMIRNENIKDECIACCTKKPGGSVAPNPPNPLSGAVTKTLKMNFGNSSDQWECPTCMIRNENSKVECIACCTKKPGGSVAPKPPNPLSGAVTKTLKMNFGNSSDQWECPTCMIRNENSKVECIACCTKKPGSTSTGKTFGGGFNTASGSTGFKFSTDTSNIKPATGFAFATDSSKASSGGFSFATSAASTSSSSGFSFASASAVTTSPSSGFSFASASASNGFSFGSTSTSKPSEGFAPTNSSITTSSGLSFGSTSTSKPSEGLSFGTSSATSPSTGSLFAPKSKPSEGLTSVTSSTTTPSSGFSFASASSNTNGFSFGSKGKPTSNLSENKANPLPSIADAAKTNFLKVTEQSDTLSNTNNLFTAPANITSSEAKPDAPSKSLIPPSTTPFSFSAASNASSTIGFGLSSHKDTDIPAPSFNFGKGTVPAVTASAPSFNFGSAPKTEAFGSGSTTSNAPAPTFNFGGAAGTQASTLFGAAPTATPLSAPPETSGSIFGSSSSGFGAAASANSVFGSAASGFGGGISNSSSASAAPVFGGFGAPNSAPPSGGSIFGGAQSAQPTASFEFGSSSGGGVPSFEVKSSGFNLSSTNSGSQQPAQAAGVGFSFSSATSFNTPADSKPAAMFGQNPLAPPANLFSMGQSNTVSQSGGPMKKRPFKKAVRRSNKPR